MLLTLLSLFFVGMAIYGATHPLDGRRFGPYFFTMLIFAALAAFFPIRHALFEIKLADAAGEVIGYDGVSVACLSHWTGILHYRAAGFVYRGSLEINMQPDTCSELRDYLSDPEAANQDAALDKGKIYALHVLTHEAMHVAGIYDEPTADCAAFQRNHLTAQALGVAPNIATQSAIAVHRLRSPRHPYYSPQCEPGGAMDENLPNAVWQRP